VFAQSNICGSFVLFYNYLNTERITDKITELKVLCQISLYSFSSKTLLFYKSKVLEQKTVATEVGGVRVFVVNDCHCTYIANKHL